MLDKQHKTFQECIKLYGGKDEHQLMDLIEQGFSKDVKDQSYEQSLLMQIRQVKNFKLPKQERSVEQIVPYELTLEQIDEIESNILKINKDTKIFINGFPKSMQSQDRLTQQKQIWFTKHGNHLVNFDRGMAEESTRLFHSIDTQRNGTITRQQIKQMISNFNDQHNSSNNGTVHKLTKMS